MLFEVFSPHPPCPHFSPWLDELGFSDGEKQGDFFSLPKSRSASNLQLRMVGHLIPSLPPPNSHSKNSTQFCPPSASFSVIYHCGKDFCNCSLFPFKKIKPTHSFIVYHPLLFLLLVPHWHLATSSPPHFSSPIPIMKDDSTLAASISCPNSF